MILWPQMLCRDTFLAPQMNTRLCAVPCLLPDRIRVTFSVFTLSDLEEKEKRRLGDLFINGTETHLLHTTSQVL